MNLLHGDCLERLKGLPDCSADSLVTDPPAGIGFMGKDWDHHKGGRSHWVAWMTEVMKECLRVMKPGAHGLVWALPRTSHWTATALEDAGFEVRDVCTHLFGQGFPKSLDVSKAIDKAAGAQGEIIEQRRPGVVNGMSMSRVSQGARPTVTVSDGAIRAPATDAARQWQGWGTALKPASEHWILVRRPISEKTVAANVLRWGTGAINVDASRILSDGKRPDICDACAKNPDDSSVNSAAKKTGRAGAASSTSTVALSAVVLQSAGESTTRSGGLTKQGTYVSNTGTMQKKSTSTSLSIDLFGAHESHRGGLSTTSTRTSKTIGLRTCSLCGEQITPDSTRESLTSIPKGARQPNTPENGKNVTPAIAGRWPSNLLLSCSCDSDQHELWCAVGELDRQSGFSKTPKSVSRNARKDTGKYGDYGAVTTACAGDSGGASRFFAVFKPTEEDHFARFAYIAKTSKRERNAGLEGMEKRKSGVMQDDNYKWTHDGKGNEINLSTEQANHHPTVKPKALMTYLIRMVTPPGGTCLDPFMGSGSTGVAAVSLGYQFTGIEQDKDYFKIAKRRIFHAMPEQKKQVTA